MDVLIRSGRGLATPFRGIVAAVMAAPRPFRPLEGDPTGSPIVPVEDTPVYRRLGLTEHQQRFVRALVMDGVTGAEAARRAGYTGAHPARAAIDLKRKPKVQEAIRLMAERMAEAADVTVDRVLVAYAALAFTGMSRFLRFQPDGTARVDLSDARPEELDAIQALDIDERTTTAEDGSVTVSRRIRIRLGDRGAALRDMAKHLRMFIETREHSMAPGMEELLRDLIERGSELPRARLVDGEADDAVTVPASDEEGEA